MHDMHKFDVAVQLHPGTFKDLDNNVAGLNQAIRGKAGDSLDDGVIDEDAFGGWVDWDLRLRPVQADESTGNFRVHAVSFTGDEYLPVGLAEAGNLARKQRALRQRRRPQGRKVLFFQLHQLAQRLLPKLRIIAAKLNDQGLHPRRIGPAGGRDRQQQKQPNPQPAIPRRAAQLSAMKQEKLAHED